MISSVHAGAPHVSDTFASAAVYRREGATSVLQVYLHRGRDLIEVELRVPTRLLPAPAPGKHKDYVVPDPAMIGTPPPPDQDRGEGARCRVVRIEATRVFVTFDGIEPECSWLRILMPPDVEVGHALTIPGARRAPWRDPTGGAAWSD